MREPMKSSGFSGETVTFRSIFYARGAGVRAVGPRPGVLIVTGVGIHGGEFLIEIGLGKCFAAASFAFLTLR
jgi:hypothetical protein